MPFSDLYRRQVALLVRILPFVADEGVFALKGGTAINLFYRDMPRLSVDIDLTYLPVASRAKSLIDIDTALKRIAETARSVSPAEDIVEQVPQKGEKGITKLFARGDGVQVKIEVTPVLRGSVFEPEPRAVSPSVEHAFGFAEMSVMSFADLFGGKIVAALDRQHPRDLFDIHGLMANEGVDARLRQAFIVYMLSHNRPMSEVLAARRKDIAGEYERGFVGMTEEPVKLDALLEAREMMIDAMIGEMPNEHREFLISFEQGEPDWSLLALDGIADLPAVRWRQQNLERLSKAQRLALVEQLKRVLEKQS